MDKKDRMKAVQSPFCFISLTACFQGPCSPTLPDELQHSIFMYFKNHFFSIRQLILFSALPDTIFYVAVTQMLFKLSLAA